MSAQLISIYLSSPGDVVDERGVMQQVIDRLLLDPLLPGSTYLRPIRWDHPAAPVPTPQSEPPQFAINTMQARPSECDVFVAVLWSRLGTPVRSADGRSFPSGTAWEIDDALGGGGRPVVLIYHRTCAPALPLNGDWRERGEQFEALQAYLSDLHERLAAEGMGAITEYETLDQFRQKLDSHLRHVVKRHLGDARPSASAPAPVRRSRSPYPGLTAYTPADSDVFFGRDREVDDLVSRVRASPFTAVVGASGSGKSSIVAAGLLPRLAAASGAGGGRWRLPSYDGDRQVWQGPRITPAAGGGAPARALALALDATAAPDGSSSVLCKRLCRAAAPEQPVIVVDQFEEVFSVSTRARDEFLDLLVALADEGLATIVVSLRADFLGSALAHEGLARHLRGALTLGPPGYAATREMIEEPARLCSLEFDAELAGTLLTDARKEPGRLPLLAFTLSELYRHRDGNQLTMDAYRAIGGVEKAIGSHAERTFAQLDPAVQDEFAPIFRRLLDIDPVGGPVRVGVRRDALADTPPGRALIDALIAARLLVAEREPTGATLVEVAHEALFSGWPRLAELIDSAHEDMLAVGRMRREAAAWQLTGDPFLLWRQEQIDNVLHALHRLGVRPTDTESRFLRPEADRLVEELQEDVTSHHRRREISSRLAALGDPRPGVGVVAGSPTIEWCRVPPDGDDDDAFWIGKYPVTVAQLHAYRRSAIVSDTESLTELEDVQCNLPAACSWIEATRFCQWLERDAIGRPQAAPPNHTMRLPTESEWRLAASREPDPAYPWGAEWDERCANAASSDLGRPIAVGMYPSGRAWTGALDLSGGVWEWCEDAQAGGGGAYVLKGGSAMEPPARCRIDGVRTMRGDVVRVDRGFRVCCGPRLPLEHDVSRR